MYVCIESAIEQVLTLLVSSGNARVTAFASTGTARTYDYQVRSISCYRHWFLTPCHRAVTSATSLHRTVCSTCPQPFAGADIPFQGHYIENIGDTDLHFLEIFDSGMSSEREYLDLCLTRFYRSLPGCQLEPGKPSPCILYSCPHSPVISGSL